MIWGLWGLFYIGGRWSYVSASDYYFDIVMTLTVRVLPLENVLNQVVIRLGAKGVTHSGQEKIDTILQTAFASFSCICIRMSMAFASDGSISNKLQLVQIQACCWKGDARMMVMFTVAYIRDLVPLDMTIYMYMSMKKEDIIRINLNGFDAWCLVDRRIPLNLQLYPVYQYEPHSNSTTRENV